MLVLTRKSKEKIIIGKDRKVVVTVLKVQGDQVSLGIEAPLETPIYREELLREIENENVVGVIDKKSIDVKSLAKKLTIPKSSSRQRLHTKR